MYAWVKKTIALVFAVSLLAIQSLVVPLQVAAQDSDETKTIQGVEISRQDILDAVESPTPNLANTTAYVLSTISVLLVNSVDPTALVKEEAPTGSTEPTTPGTPTPGGSLYRPSTLSQSLERNGLMGGMAFLTSEVIRNQPASGTEYIAYIVRGSRLAPQTAYAQGFGVGFGALSPVLSTWAAFRDVAYFLLTVMFLLVGILIIFRKKVSGNVAVTVQNALPRLVITLIAITFSYAIAGFIVDLMFWALYFIVFMFAPLMNETINFADWAGIDDPTLHEFALDTNLFNILFQYVLSGNATNAASALSEITYSAAKGIPFVEKLASLTETFGIGDLILKAIFTLIIGIAILIQSFRVFFQLIMSYAGFVINVVLSPFILLQGALPGKDPFMKWVKSLVAGLAPFVVVVFMLFMAFTLAGRDTKDGVGYKPGTGDDVGLRLPLVLTNEMNSEAFMGLLSVGFIMLLPEAVQMTKKQLGSAGPFDEFKEKALGNFKKGWEGNKYVPGAKKVAPALGTAAVGGAAGAVGGIYGGARYGRHLAGQRYANAPAPVRLGGQFLGTLFGGSIGGVAGAGVGSGVPIVAKSVGGTLKKYGGGAVQYVNKAGQQGAKIRDIRHEHEAETLYKRTTGRHMSPQDREAVNRGGPQVRRR